MNVADRIKKAHIAIMQHKEFCAMSGILACGKVTITTAIPTAATNGWDVVYNPEFVEKVMPTDPELRLLVLHEAMHKAYRHLTVWKYLSKQNARLANIAMDHFVNLSLIDTDKGEGFVKMPKEGVQPNAKYRGWNVLQIYTDLEQEDDPEDPDGGGGFDEHDFDGPPNDGSGDMPSEQDIENEIGRAIRQGEMIRKQRSKNGSGGADGMFGDLLAPKVDWRKALREFVTETCTGRDESSWARPNRRFLADDVYMPTMMGVTLQELVVGFDTSGSIFGGNEMTRFVTEIATIIEQVKPSKVHVIYWDTAIVGHQTFEDGQFAVQNLKIKGGGGTDGAVLFDYLREKAIKPSAIVQFTDGYVGEWGHTDVPTLWAVTSDIKASFGTTIKLEV
ncbi:Putative metallopeptidase domain containing protein [uncultured Caudovirales phage]|uniref:Metallopeptidase domain containing protein n=1 Tax=uncultured Caudovirales phage TaxID=2100421 RepID=A0A6J5KMI8_9CAUD|nr:Putative metallopeptidase domain containing protein [uncultured Caudovirales phage]